MITRDQIVILAKKYKTNEMVILREYIQILWLKIFYSFPESQKVFFKGGTAIHLIFKAPRFSEDLDFTVELTQKGLLKLLDKAFATFSDEVDAHLKERRTVAGKRFLITVNPSILSYKVFVNLDFSFREKVLDPQKSAIETPYPVVFTSYVWHLSKEELLAEKVRAIMTRKKGRDIYDIWYLLNQGANWQDQMVKKKLDYYQMGKIKPKEILKKVTDFKEKDFIYDLSPFVPANERPKLAEFFGFIKDYLKRF